MTTRNVIIAIALLGVGYFGFRMYKKSQLEEVTQDEDSTVRIYVKK
jgi:hypothetical protein